MILIDTKRSVADLAIRTVRDRNSEVFGVNAFLKNESVPGDVWVISTNSSPLDQLDQLDHLDMRRFS